MANYILLELDTTPPTLNIIIPPYVTSEEYAEIRITSTEKLMEYEEIYFIDALGQRHDYTFELTDYEAIGVVRFNTVAYGIGTLYARLKDEVGNLSETVYKTLAVIEGAELEVVLKETNKLQIEVKETSYAPEVRDWANMPEIRDTTTIVNLSETQAITE